jgi:hypothetical protein
MYRLIATAIRCENTEDGREVEVPAKNEELPGTLERSPRKAQRTKELGVESRSQMSKTELARAIGRKQR